jgi:hypothetical protein
VLAGRQQPAHRCSAAQHRQPVRFAQRVEGQFGAVPDVGYQLVERRSPCPDHPNTCANANAVQPSRTARTRYCVVHHAF